MSRDIVPAALPPSTMQHDQDGNGYGAATQAVASHPQQLPSVGHANRAGPPPPGFDNWLQYDQERTQKLLRAQPQFQPPFPTPQHHPQPAPTQVLHHTANPAYQSDYPAVLHPPHQAYAFPAPPGPSVPVYPTNGNAMAPSQPASDVPPPSTSDPSSQNVAPKRPVSESANTQQQPAQPPPFDRGHQVPPSQPYPGYSSTNGYSTHNAQYPQQEQLSAPRSNEWPESRSSLARAPQEPWSQAGPSQNATGYNTQNGHPTQLDDSPYSLSTLDYDSDTRNYRSPEDEHRHIRPREPDYYRQPAQPPASYGSPQFQEPYSSQQHLQRPGEQNHYTQQTTSPHSSYQPPAPPPYSHGPPNYHHDRPRDPRPEREHIYHPRPTSAPSNPAPYLEPRASTNYENHRYPPNPMNGEPSRPSHFQRSSLSPRVPAQTDAPLQTPRVRTLLRRRSQIQSAPRSAQIPQTDRSETGVLRDITNIDRSQLQRPTGSQRIQQTPNRERPVRTSPAEAAASEQHQANQNTGAYAHAAADDSRHVDNSHAVPPVATSPSGNTSSPPSENRATRSREDLARIAGAVLNTVNANASTRASRTTGRDRRLSINALISPPDAEQWAASAAASAVADTSVAAPVVAAPVAAAPAVATTSVAASAVATTAIAAPSVSTPAVVTPAVVNTANVMTAGHPPGRASRPDMIPGGADGDAGPSDAPTYAAIANSRGTRGSSSGSNQSEDALGRDTAGGGGGDAGPSDAHTYAVIANRIGNYGSSSDFNRPEDAVGRDTPGGRDSGPDMDATAVDMAVQRSGFLEGESGPEIPFTAVAASGHEDPYPVTAADAGPDPSPAPIPEDETSRGSKQEQESQPSSWKSINGCPPLWD